jgi:acetylornithine deacetylase/succinyl-diaminopimelate desuccinylase-like protein
MKSTALNSSPGFFEREGIEYEIAESAPSRGNIWAHLKGGDEPALLLLHHMDVVPASPETWNTDPLKSEIMTEIVMQFSR